ncbi:MAG: type II secretion system protein GspC [Desulfobacterales bacterium]
MIQRIFILINLGLLTLGIYYGVQLFYQVVTAEVMPVSAGAAVSQDNRPASQRTSGNSRNARAQQDFSEYQAIVNRDLFKTTETGEAEPEAEAVELDKLKQTELNLKLWGTVTGDSEKAYAVIEDKSKNRQGLYHKGDAIQNATIKMILRKKVVLRVNGEDEILVMEDEKDQSDRMDTASRSRERAAYTDGPGDQLRIDRNEIDSALNNINQLMQQVRVRPHFKNGKPNGLILTHIRNNSIFNELGLKSGDVVKGVNGEEIESVDDALKFYNNLKSSSSVELQIERGGQEKSINYQID